jgi:hypothetical protein
MDKSTFFLLKVKGEVEGKDYLQVRSNDMLLLANIRCTPPFDRLSKILDKELNSIDIESIVENLEYWKLTKIEI